MTEQERDKWHSLRVALMASDATLGLMKRVTHDVAYLEDRRAETALIVRQALKDTD